MTSDEPFRLLSVKPAVRRQRFETSERTRQQVLFAGLDCLPGQLDLFQTDGEVCEGDPANGNAFDPDREGDVHD